jgi:4-oxalocrotonate tautomerase
MPYINVKLIKQQVTKEQKDSLISGIMGIVTTIMGRNADLTVITLDELEDSNWFISGIPLSKNSDIHGKCCYIEIKISKGTANPCEMAIVLNEGKALVERVLGSNELTNYFVINELNPDSWGFDGISMTVRNQLEQK